MYIRICFAGYTVTFRAIYDSGNVHKFLRALEKKIRHYDKDIEKVCSFHYQDFIEAINKLLQLKGGCRALRVTIAFSGD